MTPNPRPRSIFWPVYWAIVAAVITLTILGTIVFGYALTSSLDT